MSGRRPQAAGGVVFRLLVSLYPAGFRDEFGDQMMLCVQQQMNEAHRTRGLPGVVMFWLTALMDVGTVSIKERLSMWWQDARFSIRTLWRSPAFTCVVVATLALGIGASTTIFSVINCILLKPMPFRDADRIAMVYLNGADRGFPRMYLSLADYLDWRTHDRAFSDAAAFGTFGRFFTWSGRGEPEQVSGTYATAGFFSLLGVQPLHGRVFERGDDQPGRIRTAVISERLWHRLGASPDILGSVVKLNGDPHTIIGVVPGALRFP
ncbi:MAG TPA: ABC transporter permease, partial [Bryobacteraceae bacterium]|nr:ABC transporter permease [Bryobacteraceae bacterium]